MLIVPYFLYFWQSRQAKSLYIGQFLVENREAGRCEFLQSTNFLGSNQNPSQMKFWIRYIYKLLNVLKATFHLFDCHWTSQTEPNLPLFVSRSPDSLSFGPQPDILLLSQCIQPLPGFSSISLLLYSLLLSCKMKTYKMRRRLYYALLQWVDRLRFIVIWDKDRREGKRWLTCGCHEQCFQHNSAELITSCMNLWFNSPGCSLVAVVGGEEGGGDGCWWNRSVSPSSCLWDLVTKPRLNSPLPSAVNNNKVMNRERERCHSGASFKLMICHIMDFSSVWKAFRSQCPNSSLPLQH